MRDTMTTSTMTATVWGLMLVLSLVWGATFFFAKVALPAIPPLTLVFGRVAIGGIVLAAVLPLAGMPFPKGRPVWIALFGMGLLNNVLPFSLIFWGQSLLPRAYSASLSSILNAATPLFTVLVCHLLTTDERITPPKAVGVALGFAGVATLVAPALAGNDTTLAGGTTLLGMAACLGATVIYAFSGVFGRRFKRLGVSSLQAAFGQLAASSVMMAPLSLLVDQPWTRAMPGPAPLLALLGLAVLSTALAYVMFFAILERAGATILMLVTFLIPPSAILLGTLVLGERLAPAHLVGMVLIACGLAVIDGRAFAAIRSFSRRDSGPAPSGGPVE